MYRILSWACYYLGDWACSIMYWFDNFEFWVAVWFPVYQKFMCWSIDLQSKGGFDTDKVLDTSDWPWYKRSENDGET